MRTSADAADESALHQTHGSAWTNWSLAMNTLSHHENEEEADLYFWSFPCPNYWCLWGLQLAIPSPENPECLTNTNVSLPKLQRSKKCNGSFLEMLNSDGMLLSQFELSVTSQVPANWPAGQSKLSLCAYVMYVSAHARLWQHFSWLLGS